MNNHYNRNQHNLSALNYADFYYNGYSYYPEVSSVDLICHKLFDLGIDGVYEELNLVLLGNTIKNVTAKLESINEIYNINVTFSNYNSTTFVVPNEDELSGIVGASLSKEVVNSYVGYTLEEALEELQITVEYNSGSQTYEALTFSYVIDKPYNSTEASSYVITFDVYGVFLDVKLELAVPPYEKYDIQTPIKNAVESEDYSIGLPSVGTPKVLVIPIAFTDYRADRNMKANLEKAFFGTSADTGWESLQSYYYESSYGKLKIEGTVLDPYQTNYSSSYYNRKYKNGQDSDYEIIKAALSYYDSMINYADYDYNKDGYIDSIYFVYTAPVDYNDDESLWWAFTYEYYTSDYEYYDGVEADYYCFMGYDFFFETTASGKRLTLNCETVIHETGHLFGLPDYYDYDDSVGPSGGIGGGDMMDYNVGDHNPFSKLMLGWLSPYICTSTINVDLRSFAESGECIILIPSYNGNLFQEFYIIDYYTPTGLNELEKGQSGLFSTSGVRIYHVAANRNTKEIYSVFDFFANDNSLTTNKLLSLVQVSGSNSILQGEFATNRDLLQSGSSYQINNWYSGYNNKFTISVKSSLNNTMNIVIK